MNLKEEEYLRSLFFADLEDHKYLSDIITLNFNFENSYKSSSEKDEFHENKEENESNQIFEDLTIPKNILAVKRSDSKNKFKFNLGHWTKEEHNKYLDALILFQNDYKKISKIIKTRSIVQIRSHSQKYFNKFKEKMLNNVRYLVNREQINKLTIIELIKIYILCNRNKNISQKMAIPLHNKEIIVANHESRLLKRKRLVKKRVCRFTDRNLKSKKVFFSLKFRK